MTYNDVIKKLESIGVEIDYTVIQVSDVNALCKDINGFESKIRQRN